MVAEKSHHRFSASWMRRKLVAKGSVHTEGPRTKGVSDVTLSLRPKSEKPECCWFQSRVQRPENLVG
jgi:hypothetical protein